MVAPVVQSVTTAVATDFSDSQVVGLIVADPFFVSHTIPRSGKRYFVSKQESTREWTRERAGRTEKNSKASNAEERSRNIKKISVLTFLLCDGPG